MPTLTETSLRSQRWSFACRKVEGMGKPMLALDTILSVTFYFTTTWSSDLQGNKALYLSRYVVCRFYKAWQSQVTNAQLALV